MTVLEFIKRFYQKLEKMGIQVETKSTPNTSCAADKGDKTFEELDFASHYFYIKNTKLVQEDAFRVRLRKNHSQKRIELDVFNEDPDIELFLDLKANTFEDMLDKIKLSEKKIKQLKLN